MKTVSVSEIIRTAHLGDTTYVLAGDAADFEAEIAQKKIDLKLALDLLDGERERIKVLEAALYKIAYPIKYLQSNLKEGEQLNGVMALELADNSSWLKEIARAALEVK